MKDANQRYAWSISCDLYWRNLGSLQGPVEAYYLSRVYGSQKNTTAYSAGLLSWTAGLNRCLHYWLTNKLVESSNSSSQFDSDATDCCCQSDPCYSNWYLQCSGYNKTNTYSDWANLP